MRKYFFNLLLIFILLIPNCSYGNQSREVLYIAIKNIRLSTDIVTPNGAQSSFRIIVDAEIWNPSFNRVEYIHDTSCQFKISGIFNFGNVTYTNHFNKICGKVTTSAYYRSGITSISDINHLIFMNYTGINLPNGNYYFYFGDSNLFLNNHTYGIHLKSDGGEVTINYDKLPSNWGYNDNYHFYLGLGLLTISIMIFILMWYRYRIKVNKFRNIQKSRQGLKSKKIIYNEKFN